MLTVISDFVGMFGGFIIAVSILGLSPKQYWTTVWQALAWDDISQGVVLKPLLFAVTIALIGCYYGLRASAASGSRPRHHAGYGHRLLLIFVLDAISPKSFCVRQWIANRPPDPALRSCHRSFDGEVALEDVSFDAYERESRVILGAAGSGRPCSSKPRCADQARIRQRCIGHSLQDPRHDTLFRNPQRRACSFRKRPLRFDDHRGERAIRWTSEEIKCPSRSPHAGRAALDSSIGTHLKKFPANLRRYAPPRRDSPRLVTRTAARLYDSPPAGLTPTPPTPSCAPHQEATSATPPL